jgi:hypothetical protein
MNHHRHHPAPQVVNVLLSGAKIILTLDKLNKYSKTGNAIKVLFDMNTLSEPQWDLLAPTVKSTFGGKEFLTKEPIMLGYIAEARNQGIQKKIADYIRSQNVETIEDAFAVDENDWPEVIVEAV